MKIATHLIKINGKFDKNIWTEEKLDVYVRSKIECDIDKLYHADLELFKIDDEIIDVWVFISVSPSKVTRDIIGKWIKNHITEEGIIVIDFEIEERFNLCHPEEVFVTLL
jgi:hypothetical protein